jgi:hypothetical protein
MIIDQVYVLKADNYIGGIAVLLHSECRGELYMIGGYICSQAGAKPAFFFFYSFIHTLKSRIMKRVFTSRKVKIDLVKGFVFGIGLSDTNKYFTFLIGFVLIEIELPSYK